MAKKKPSTTSASVHEIGSLRAAQAPQQTPDLEGMLPEWARFLTDFPTVPAAVKAAVQGHEVMIASSEHTEFRRRVLVTGDGPVIEDTIYPHIELQDVISTAWLNHPAPDHDTAQHVKEFLLSIVPDGTPVDRITVVQEQGHRPVPLFGYQTTVPADGMDSWAEVDARTTFGPLYAAMKYVSNDRLDLTSAQFADLRRRGFAVQACAGCGRYLTNGHPSWPGVWIVLGEEGGPSCPDADNDGRWNDVYTITVHGPHLPAPEGADA
ncbi:hypothetical protein ACFVUN_34470 [Kitasatospora griseola]|uniref:hypothetical protein n=1 Tax=Kitasatospora griseola TaxID=2064 RepID=UPI0036D8F7FA